MVHGPRCQAAAASMWDELVSARTCRPTAVHDGLHHGLAAGSIFSLNIGQVYWFLIACLRYLDRLQR